MGYRAEEDYPGSWQGPRTYPRSIGLAGSGPGYDWYDSGSQSHSDYLAIHGSAEEWALELLRDGAGVACDVFLAERVRAATSLEWVGVLAGAVLTFGPESVAALSFCAQAAALAGDRRAAVHFVERLSERAAFPAVWAARAQVLATAGRVAEAIEQVDLLCSMQPADRAGQMLRARVLAKAQARCALPPGESCPCGSGNPFGDCCSARESAALARFADGRGFQDVQAAVARFGADQPGFVRESAAAWSDTQTRWFRPADAVAGEKEAGLWSDWALTTIAPAEGESGSIFQAFKDAEEWLKKASARIRDARFAPIADRAGSVWKMLQGPSSVRLQRITLQGASTQRRVSLDVTVDGVGGAALGVMSQGELHSLALSLFLPRALLEDSPFGFIVIDDPVQSMDPGRVEGLARVLEEAARTRQVVVFTHDDRLPEACRQLQVAADMIEVTRSAKSVVDLRPVSTPISRYIDDARAVASTNELSEAIVARVAGVFCRLALEAACVEAVVRRRLGRGEPHLKVEAALADAPTLTKKAALALFDDASRGGDVLARLNRMGSWAADTYQAVNKGSHQLVSAAKLKNIVDDTGRLAVQLAAQR